jgi:hypothetical protein
MKTRGIAKTGRSQYERTNPDYVDETVSRLARDYNECPKEWRKTFIEGLRLEDRRALIEMGVLAK